MNRNFIVQLLYCVHNYIYQGRTGIGKLYLNMVILLNLHNLHKLLYIVNLFYLKAAYTRNYNT